MANATGMPIASSTRNAIETISISRAAVMVAPRVLSTVVTSSSRQPTGMLMVTHE